MAVIAVLNLLFFSIAAPIVNPVKVIVFPLNGPLKNTSLAWLSEGIAVSLSEQISGHGVKTMDRGERVALIESIDLPPGAQLSRGSMIRVAQKASADFAVMGSYSGPEKNLKISVRVLDVKALKLSGEISANGPLSVLPQMENELAWLILSNNGLEKAYSRAGFQEKTRSIPNAAFAWYIQSFGAQTEGEQLQLLKKSVEAYRDFPEAHFRMGSLYFYKGDCSSAIPHLAMGNGQASVLAEDQFMLGTCYLQSDQSDKAIQTYSRILQVSRPYEVLNNLGAAYLRRGDEGPAITAFLEAKKLAPANSTVSLNLAIARHLQRNDSAARSVLEDAIKIDADNGMLQFVLGFLLKLQNENEAAAAVLEKARNLGVDREKLQHENPTTWTRIITAWEASRKW